ncbi:DUF3068 domain-containing protein [Micromonospora radicis]|uniref:DUF3068 domain-containing protein n=1 Tax=Micromonospora radicis TaxID=1894971 RepID=A0A418MNF2_9ACTN|nr:DUF3068 domain-containing protein [Micromonospora radicis]RIV32598.1 DUF3068 domain-containing protein [Micromonospora radicis]
MRPATGVVLVATGTFLIVGALAMPLYVAPAVVKVPLDQSSVTYSRAQNATVLDFQTLSERSGVDLTAVRAVRGDVEAGNADRAVFNVGVRVTDEAGTEITVSRDRVALDRRTGEAIACCAEDINGTPFKHDGLTYTFPFGTEKKTYRYFDNTARKAYDATYHGTEQLQGLTVYRFEMTVEPVQVDEIKVPGHLVGSAEQMTTVGRFYTNKRTLWVEPNTGVIVKGQEDQLQTLRGPNGTDAIRIIDADLAFDEETQKQQADVARDAMRQINLVTVLVPIVLGVLGLALLVLGLLLFFRANRRAEPPAPVAVGDSPEPDLDSPASADPQDEPTGPAQSRPAERVES